jgi:hypothetical protein
MTSMSDLVTPNLPDQLLPDRHPQAGFFICDVADAVLKDLIPQMEHPFYALGKKPETAIRRYSHEGVVILSVKGHAIICGKDTEASSTIAAFCAIADQQGWGLGETMEKAVELLEREHRRR